MPESQPGYPPAHSPHAQQMHPSQSQDSLAMQQQQTGAGVAGLGAGTDAEAQHKAAWDEYYRLHPEALAAHQAQQQNGQQGQEYADPNAAAQQGQAYGQSPYPAHPQAGGASLGHGQSQDQLYPQQQQQQRPGSYYAPQQQGGSVENLAHGMQRMGVQQ
jgi:hypothetical protein